MPVRPATVLRKGHGGRAATWMARETASFLIAMYEAYAVLAKKDVRVWRSAPGAAPAKQ